MNTDKPADPPVVPAEPEDRGPDPVERYSEEELRRLDQAARGQRVYFQRMSRASRRSYSNR